MEKAKGLMERDTKKKNKNKKPQKLKEKSRKVICSARIIIHSDVESKEALSEFRGKELRDKRKQN